MAIKSVTYQFKGMNRDLSNINASNQFAYEIRNMKITANEDNTLLSISTNKGTKETDIKIKGTPIGHATIDNEWVIFCAGTNNCQEIPDMPNTVDGWEIQDQNDTIVEDIRFTEQTDYIYKITKTNQQYSYTKVYGNLNLDTSHPIETIVSVENEELKKVYWTDNKNQLRFINLDRINDQPITSSEVDFISEVIKNEEKVTISKNSSIGMFPAGTTQYVFSYINYYGQQSNLFHISSIYYNVSGDKALEVNKVSSDSYKIEIKDLNNQDYQYVRIYSIVRTSQDSVPEVRVVTDFKIEGIETLEYIDRHTTGYTIDPTELFYIGGEQLIVGTITQKDNTLFIGDITQKKEVLSEDIIQQFQDNNNISTQFVLDKEKYITEIAGDTFYANHFRLKDTPSEKLTTFKMGDYYRIGVQLMHNSGRWSEPIYIGDYKNTEKIRCDFNNDKKSHYHKLISIKTTIQDSELLSQLKGLGYIKIRPIIVYPELEDRVTLCQGYLCPTVYNIGERCNNGIWAQSSWFARPFTSYKYNPSARQKDQDTSFANQEQKVGSALEFRHNAYIGGKYTQHLELQCADRSNTYVSGNYTLAPVATDNKITSFIKEHSHQFFVDNSIITMHSPEIEFNDSLNSVDLKKYKLRIIGYLPLTSNQGDIDIITSTSGSGFNNNADTNGGFIPFDGSGQQLYTGFFKKIRSSKNYSKNGHKVLCSGFFYRDGFNWAIGIPLNINNTQKYLPYEKFEIIMGYNISSFQARGSIKGGGSEESKLQYKKISNVRYSYRQNYLPTPYSYDTEDCLLYNSETTDRKNLNIGDRMVQYSGNIDTLLTGKYIDNNGSLQNGCRTYLFPNVEITNYTILNGYKIAKSGKLLTPSQALDLYGSYNSGAINTNPIQMRYKSTPHIVISLSNKAGQQEDTQQILPVVNGNVLNDWWANDNSQHKYVWDSTTKPKKIEYKEINPTQYSGLFLAELYNENVNSNTIFGGKSSQDIVNNKWTIAGKEVPINNNLVELYYTEGDTYYQRYDNLKTYPWSMEEANGITDVISFMVETRINLEGRYDSNKADKPHFHILPSNFNLINKAYTQKNNFFSYYGIDYDRINVNKHPNLVSWSKTKTAGELIDTWLNLNLSSTLDLDGSKGRITSLQNYNGDILAFQDKSLSQILYNEQTQISTQAGVPIEIANSGKVTGYRSISNQVGCSNKWSICQTPNGLYFLDSFNKDLYRLGEGLNNLSNTNGFNSYLRNIDNIEKPWNPQTLYSIKTSYDPINKEVLFSTKDETLSYSEQLQTFMSFYDFNIDYFTTLQGNSLILTNNNNNIYEYQKGYHNFYFGKIAPYSIEFISNPDPLNDKVFNTLEFRSDSWYDYGESNTGQLADFETFDKLYVKNEYQNIKTNLVYNKYGLSNLKKRFRIWKTQIPRDQKYPKDRIRNTWTKIKLEKTPQFAYNCKTILHDLTVYYNI